MTYQEQKFNTPALKGISVKTIEEHLKLYSGYVKNANLILEKIDEYRKESDRHAYALGELERRFSFEYNGIRNHEHYFRQFEGGPRPLPQKNPLRSQIEKQWGSYESWLAMFQAIAMTRGIGWAMLYYDPEAKALTHAWVDEQHLGQLQGLPLILGLDMWEHSYMLDYPPSEKKKYVGAFFANLNWPVVQKRFKA